MTGQDRQTPTSGHGRRRRVIVGVGSSPAGHAAIRVGAEIAESFSLPLHLVRVWRDVDRFLSARADRMLPTSDQQRDRHVLQEAAIAARSLAPGVPVTAEFVAGSVYAVLLDDSVDANVLVLGCGDGHEPGLIGQWYLEHARCPVLVVDAGGQVVADSIDEPLAWAFAETEATASLHPVP